MMNKRYKQGGVLLLALALAGCSADTASLSEGEGGSHADAMSKSYVTLSLSMSSGKGATRAAGEPHAGEVGDGQEGGKDYENAVSSVIAFFFKGDNGANRSGDTDILKVVTFAPKNGTDGSGQTGNGHDIDKVYSMTRQVELGYGTYNVIAVANLGAEGSPDGWWNTPGLKLGQVRDRIIDECWDESESGYSRFLMSSEGDATITLTKDNYSPDNAAKVDVSVERMAARVDYCAKASYQCDDEAYKGATASILGAALVNNLTAGSYLLKRVADGVSQAPTGSGVTYLGDETVDGGGLASNYVLDPWTSLKTPGNIGQPVFTIPDYSGSVPDGGSVAAERLFGVYYTSFSEDPDDWNRYVGNRSESDKMDDGGVDGAWYRAGYTLENTTPGGDVHSENKYYNTGIVFKARFTPAEGSVNNSFSNLSYKAGQTFFELANSLFATMEDMADWFYSAAGLRFLDVYEELDCMTWEEASALAESIPANDPSGYGPYLAGLANGKSDTLTYEERQSLSWMAYMKAQCGYSYAPGSGVTLDSWPDGEGRLSSTREALTQYGVRTYKDAICYYTWWIMHANDIQQGDEDNGVEGVMEHGVVRNNIYKLNVSSIYTIGDDVPGNTTLRVRATVNAWVLLDGEDIVFGPSETDAAGWAQQPPAGVTN